MVAIIQLVFKFLLLRTLFMLGVGIISYMSLTSLANTLIAKMQLEYNSIPQMTLDLLNLAGVGQFLGIICSAIVVRAGFMAMKKFGAVASAVSNLDTF
ncbi:DUF2523 family protein [Methylomonas sp. CM2]|uniref:DUF2523 family protein n=1 Tax=Methylomonas sp. CM2 TaxID=3417647 RepID=UPI003CEE23DB